MAASTKKMLKALGKLKPTDWKAATPPQATATDFKAHIEARLDYFRFRTSAPIRTIIGSPANLYFASAMSNSALLVALMNNMYTYGQGNWKWVRGSPAKAQDAFEDAVKTHIASLDFPAQLRWKAGRGLLDGTVSSAVCGSFNSAFKFVAYEIFDVPGIKCGTGGPETQISDSFITMPGRQPIDSDWNGNVWVLGASGDISAAASSNEQLRALRFTGHFFVNHAGTIYDVTGNRTYTNSNDMIWCKLNKNVAKTAAFPNSRDVFDVQVVNPSAAAKAAKYCVDLGEEPSDIERFSKYLLTDRESLTATEMKTAAAWSSCT